jgi:outer membrane receptor protein involved in Fe transport
MEVNYLRLDQSDVELPGQAFDIESLTTNGISVQYSWEQSFGLDHVELALWYNRTRLDGDNRRPAKRRQFPIYDDRDFVAETDVDSLSLGYRLAGTWGDVDCPHLTAGTDLRSVEQELNEIAISGTVGPIHLDGNNSPIPRSRTVDPGIFVEQVLPVTEATTLKAGGRVDYFCAAPLKDVWQLGPIGTKGQPYPNVVGTDDVKHDRLLWLLYLVSRTAFDEHWSVTLGAGHSERPPNLTELYVAESFMFLLQNGLNTVTGDPLLRPERLWQLDASVSFTSARLRWEATGFLAWIQDKITFENLSVVGEPNQPVDQVNLKYVNTALATLAGVELRGRCLLRPWLTAFATLSYVAGEDWTRNGDFATDQVSLTEPSSRVYGLPRGFFSGVSGGVHEPLPGIAPLESRVGLTVHDSTERPRWAVELSCRMVDSQDRVASSLLEQPTPGFVVWDVRSFFRVTKHWLLATGVENVGNRTYREHLDFRPAGPAAADRFTMCQPGVNIYWVSELSY